MNSRQLYWCLSLLATVFVLFSMITTSDASSDVNPVQNLAERQKLPSIESIKKFFTSIDQSMIDRLRNTVKIANLIARLRKLIQFKQQLREGLNKRMELNGSGIKSIDKSLKLILSPTNWSSIFRLLKTNDKNVDQNSMDSMQQMIDNNINDNPSIEGLQNIKLK